METDSRRATALGLKHMLLQDHGICSHSQNKYRVCKFDATPIRKRNFFNLIVFKQLDL
jgi:hypothetical protein